MNFVNLVFVIGCLLFGFSTQVTHNESGKIVRFEKKYLKDLKDSGYNTHVKPVEMSLVSPLKVKCTMYLLDVHRVDEQNMEYQAQFYFRQNWFDSRLAYEKQDNEVILNDRSLIWIPDVFFVQEKEGVVNTVTQPNVFIKISPDGHVLYSARVSVTFRCPMEFTKYPHDTQTCVFSAESYGHQKKDILLSWAGQNSVMYDTSINPFPFRLVSVKESEEDEKVSTGEYRVLRVAFTFKRQFGFFLTRLYLPYAILVILSWISFWIPTKMITMRLTLLLVLLYLVVNIGSDMNQYIPRVAYTKASDVWLAICQSFVFAAFLEFIGVHILARNKGKIGKSILKNDPESVGVLESEEPIKPEKQQTSNSVACMVACRLKKDFLSARVDKLSRILFPVLFFIFNFIYWLVFCTSN